MEHHGFANYDTHDRWKANLGRFPEGTTIEYSLEVAGANQTIKLERFAVTVSNAAAAIRWIGNLRTDPEPGALDPGDRPPDLLRNAPPGVAVSAEVGYFHSTMASLGKPSRCRAEFPPTATTSWFGKPREIPGRRRTALLCPRPQRQRRFLLGQQHRRGLPHARELPNPRRLPSTRAATTPAKPPTSGSISRIPDAARTGRDRPHLAPRPARCRSAAGQSPCPSGRPQTLIFPWQTPTERFSRLRRGRGPARGRKAARFALERNRRQQRLAPLSAHGLLLGISRRRRRAGRGGGTGQIPPQCHPVLRLEVDPRPPRAD